MFGKYGRYRGRNQFDSIIIQLNGLTKLIEMVCFLLMTRLSRSLLLLRWSLVKFYLCNNNTKRQENIKQLVMKAISNDCDVQFYWTLISQDIDEEGDAIELLLDIADMWITICGFSLASSCLEAY